MYFEIDIYYKNKHVFTVNDSKTIKKAIQDYFKSYSRYNPEMTLKDLIGRKFLFK